MLANEIFTPEDEAYIISVRREIHRHPEIGFELYNTSAIVKRELDKMGIAYTESYGKCSVVGTLNPGKAKVIGLRADMDALPVQEDNDLPFKSEIDGAMHACGHDTHTAMLLGAARVLKRVEDKLNVTVKLIFQPAEESDVSGAQMMAENGVMDDIDECVAIHVDNIMEPGTVGLREGNFQAACHPYMIEFFGKSTHAAIPQNGHDALAMAVKAYNDIYIMKCREFSPFFENVLSISSIQAGHAHNVMAEYAKVLITFRFYDMEAHEKADARIKEICRKCASEMGGTVKFTDNVSAYPVVNDKNVTRSVWKAAEKVVGESNVVEAPKRMSSEDFSHFSMRKPSTIIRLSTHNDALGCTEAAHTGKFKVDESALKNGSKILIQVVLDK